MVIIKSIAVFPGSRVDWKEIRQCADRLRRLSDSILNQVHAMEEEVPGNTDPLFVYHAELEAFGMKCYRDAEKLYEAAEREYTISTAEAL